MVGRGCLGVVVGLAFGRVGGLGFVVLALVVGSFGWICFGFEVVGDRFGWFCCGLWISASGFLVVDLRYGSGGYVLVFCTWCIGCFVFVLLVSGGCCFGF